MRLPNWVGSTAVGWGLFALHLAAVFGSTVGACWALWSGRIWLGVLLAGVWLAAFLLTSRDRVGGKASGGSMPAREQREGEVMAVLSPGYFLPGHAARGVPSRWQWVTVRVRVALDSLGIGRKTVRDAHEGRRD